MSPAKKASAKQVATTYFDAIAARDVEAMAALLGARAASTICTGWPTCASPDDLEAVVRQPLPGDPGLRDVGDRHGRLRRQGGGPLGARPARFTGPGKFEGLTATGASIEIEGLDLLTIRDGLVHENFAYTNATELARQFGAMPPAGSAGERAMLGMVNARTAADRAHQARA